MRRIGKMILIIVLSALFLVSLVSASDTYITRLISGVNLGQGNMSSATFYDATGGNTIVSAENIVLDSTLTNNDPTMFSLSGENVTYGETGLYEIFFKANFRLGSGTRTGGTCYLQLWNLSSWSTIASTTTTGYTRLVTEYHMSAVDQITYNINAGEKTRIRCSSQSVQSIVTRPDSKQVIKRLSGARGIQGLKGDKGDDGVDGNNTYFDRNETSGDVFLINSTDSLGIGTEITGGLLHIYNPSGDGAGSLSMVMESALNKESFIQFKDTSNRFLFGLDNVGGNPDLVIYNYGTATYPMYIEASTGDFGIKTTNPTVDFHVVGKGKFTDELQLAGAENDPLSPTLNFGEDTGFYEQSNNILGVSIGGVQKWRWAGDQFISTTTDGAGLMGEVCSATNPTVFADRTDQDSGLGCIDDADTPVLVAGGVAGLVVKELAGAITVGIATTTPNRPLHIHEPSGNQNYMKFSNTDTGEALGNGALIGLTSTEELAIWQREDDHIVFYTNDTEKMRIKNNGYVGIGTTNPNTKLQVDGTARFGNTTSYTETEEDGTLFFKGDATVWDDLLVPFTTGARGLTSPPTLTQFRDDGAGSTGAFEYVFHSSTEQELFTSAQLPHKYKEGTEIQAHIHWATSGSSTDCVVWGIEWTDANIGDAFPQTTISKAIDCASGTPYEHLIISIVNMSIGAGAGTISNIIPARVFRDASNVTDNMTDEVFGLYLDYHFEIDTVGSRTATTK